MVTVAALGALAVGGAAFAQAQNASTATAVPTQQSVGHETSSSDTDNVQAGNQGGRDEGSKADPEDSASGQDGGPEPAFEQNDGPDGPGDQAEGPGADREAQD